jgi:hypothetical protein
MRTVFFIHGETPAATARLHLATGGFPVPAME